MRAGSTDNLLVQLPLHPKQNTDSTIASVCPPYDALIESIVSILSNVALVGCARFLWNIVKGPQQHEYIVGVSPGLILEGRGGLVVVVIRINDGA